MIFNGIRVLLQKQFQRLSDLEKELISWLAINREPVSIAQLRSSLVSPISSHKILEALESLRRRNLIENIVIRLQNYKNFSRHFAV